jgi:hypothetical protein
MDIELNPPVDIQAGAFNLLVSPEDIAIRALRGVVEPRQFLVLYVCGNYSRLLSRINLRTAEFDIRRAFTSSQLLSILDDAHQTFVFLEHDASLFAESEEMIEYVSIALRELSRESTVLLYSPEFDATLQAISKKADRVFYFDRTAGGESVRGRYSRRRGMAHNAPPADDQSTLEAF